MKNFKNPRNFLIFVLAAFVSLPAVDFSNMRLEPLSLPSTPLSLVREEFITNLEELKGESKKILARFEIGANPSTLLGANPSTLLGASNLTASAFLSDFKNSTMNLRESLSALGRVAWKKLFLANSLENATGNAETPPANQNIEIRNQEQTEKKEEKREDVEQAITTVVQSIPFDISSFKQELLRELDAYITSFKSTQVQSAIYQTVTRQSNADADRRSVTISNVITGGTLSGSTITGADVSGPSGNFTSLTFNTATGTSATSTNFFSTYASSTNLFATAFNFGSGVFGNSTSSNATTTNLFATTASSTNLFFTTGSGGNFTSTGLGTFFNLLLNASSTLQNFTFVNATGTSATSTNFFSTYASSTNLFATAFNFGSGVFGNSTSSNATTTNLFATTASSTNLFFTTGSGGNFTSTGLGTFFNLLLNASSTLQNFTFVNATGTAATTTNFFSTTASSTNLYATNLFANTANLTESTNLFYTDARVNSYIHSSSTIPKTYSANTFTGAQIFDSITRSTTTSATSTNFFSTTASTNLFATYGNIGTLTVGTCTGCGGGDAFAWTPGTEGNSTSTRLIFGNGFISQASSTISANLTISGNSTTTNATTTNLFSTTASSTNLFSSLLTVGGTGLVVDSSRNVGIGTTAPTSKLSVNGSFSTMGTTTDTSQDATGGTITHSGGYTIHTFTSSGTFTPNGAGDVEYLVVAGGGGGSSGRGGGGGAGGMRSGTLSITAGDKTVTVGAGGAGGTAGFGYGSSGSNSVFSSITASGGGRGAQPGGNGGSGGGATEDSGGPYSGGTGNSGSYTPAEGNNGGNSNVTSVFTGGGGGGAGAAGSNGSASSGGNGGAGSASSISGASVTYAGGGGAGASTAAAAGSGGSGGGGTGGTGGNPPGVGTAGTDNTGGGGGGGGFNSTLGSGANGGAGGSGIVIIRYLTATTTGSLFTINSFGSVGIGTTAPAQALDVVGSIQLSANLLPSAAPTQASSSQTITRVDTTGNVGQYTSTTIGTDGFPVIAYYDVTNTDLKVIKCGNAACSSNTVTTADTDGGDHVSMAIGTDGLPVVSFVSVAGKLRIVHCGNAACSSGNTAITPTGTAASSGMSSSIVIGKDGLPVISYRDNTNGDLAVYHCANISCTSGSTVTVDNAAGEQGYYASLKIGVDGLPIISYYTPMNNGDLKVVHCGNVDCSSGNTITSLETTGDVGQYTSMVIRQDGTPLIFYYDNTNGDLKSADCGNIACTSVDVASAVTTNDVGQYASATIGPNGTPIVSFYDVTNGNLMMTECASELNGAIRRCDTVQKTTTLDSTNDVGKYTSIFVAPDGLPFIAYYDNTNGDLKTLKCATADCSVTSGGGSFSAGSNIGHVGAYFNNIYANSYWGKQFQIANFDLAEEYVDADNSLEPGDVVCLKTQDAETQSPNSIYKCDTNSGPTLGIISTKPALILGAWRDDEPTNVKPVALSGRVPVKVTDENGAIKKGDHLTLSKTKPGFAMKQTEAGQSIGIALEQFSISNVQTGKVMTFVNLSYWIPELGEQIISDNASSTASTTPATIGGLVRYVIDKISSIFEIVFEKGLLKVAKIIADKITAREVDTERLCIRSEAGETCVTKDQLDALLSNAGIGAVITEVMEEPEEEAQNEETQSTDSTSSPQAEAQSTQPSDSAEATSDTSDEPSAGEVETQNTNSTQEPETQTEEAEEVEEVEIEEEEIAEDIEQEEEVEVEEVEAVVEEVTPEPISEPEPEPPQESDAAAGQVASESTSVSEPAAEQSSAEGPSETQ